MFFGEKVCLMLLGTFFSFLPLHESVFKKLGGYDFPVYSTDFCPRNDTEWKKRSKVLNCTEENGYTCLPNEHFTELLQFCYTDPHILIEEGHCLYLIKSNSLVHGYNCHNFRSGCPSSSYISTKIYDYPSCIQVENGCFLADKNCKRSITTSYQTTTEHNDIGITIINETVDSTATYLQETTVYVQREIDTNDDKRVVLFITLLAVCFPIFLSMVVFIIFKKKIRKCRKKDSAEDGPQITTELPPMEQQRLVDKGGPQNTDELPLLAEDQPKLDKIHQSRTRTNGHTEEQWLSTSSTHDKTAHTNDQNKKSKSTRYAVAAIDFGTAYSGYAYSVKSEWERIHMNKQWYSGNFSSTKAPTAMLLQNETFYAFGYEAENRYSDLVEDDPFDDEEKRDKKKKDEYYFFQRFKDILYKQNLDVDHDIEDITGKKKMKAIIIVSMLIAYLKKSLIEAMNLSIPKGKISEADVDFVLAVPAKCGERAKLFMQNAAKKAGIEEDQLTIVFEEEAISSYCQHMHFDHPSYTHTQDDTFKNDLENVKKYIVVNLGEDRINITINEQAEDGTLEKLLPSTIDHSGGFSVKDEFEKLMENIGGKDILKSFANDNMQDYLSMLREFEAKKNELWRGNVTIKIPHSFYDFLKKRKEGGIEKALQDSIYKVIYSKYKLRLMHPNPAECTEFYNFFQKTIQNVLNIIEQSVQETGVKVLIMVGGYADLEIFRDSLQTRFNSYRVVTCTPREPELAVLKSAVYLGHFPNTKQSRVQCYIYV